MFKAAKLFNGDYASNPYETAERDVMYSNKKDVVKNAKKIGKQSAKKKTHSAIDSTLKGAVLGGAFGAGVGGLVAGKEGAKVGGVAMAALAGLSGGLARATSNSNIAEGKSIAKSNDSKIERNIVDNAYATRQMKDAARYY